MYCLSLLELSRSHVETTKTRTLERMRLKIGVDRHAFPFVSLYVVLSDRIFGPREVFFDQLSSEDSRVRSIFEFEGVFIIQCSRNSESSVLSVGML